MSKTALITGASSGIGADFARALAKDGYDVILVARRADRLQALADELKATREMRAEVIPADLVAPGAAAQVSKAVADLGLHVDLLVNNAGLGNHGPFIESAVEVDQKMIDLNISALTSLTHAFVPGMVERGQGGVINVASTASFQPIPFMAVYAATKAYVLFFSEALAEEVGPKGVKVVCLCPGPTQTEFVEVAEFKTDVINRVPMMSSAAVVREGLDALKAGRTVQVAGLMNAMQAMAPRFAPRSVVTKISGMLFKPNK
jgi:short-subunit dehydrogenase